MSSLKELFFKNNGQVIEDKKYGAIIVMDDDNTKRVVDEDVDEYVTNYIHGFHNYELLSEVYIPPDCKYLGIPKESDKPSFAQNRIRAGEWELSDYGAFQNCVNLKNVEISKYSILNIVCNNCFYNCKELETIDFRNCNELYEIREGAFINCDKLKKIYMNYKNYVDCFNEFSNFGNGTFIFDSNNKSKSAIVSGVVRTLAGDEYKLEDIEIPFRKRNGKRVPPSNLNELFYKQYGKDLNLKSPKHFSLLAPTAGLEGSGEIISLTKEDYNTVEEWELTVIPKIQAERTEPIGNPPRGGSGGHVDLEKMVLKFKDIPETPSSGKQTKRGLTRTKSLPTKLSKMTKKASRRRSFPNKFSSTKSKSSKNKSLPTKLSSSNYSK